MDTKRLAVFANGCFWCSEAVFSRLKGVHAVVPVYTGGTVENPTYEQVSTGTTGHAEALQITYDPSVLSYDDLLAVFFNTHDPTTLNRQGADIGTQYRSAIFYSTNEEKQKAEHLIAELNATHAYPGSVVTDVVPLGALYPAEEYHRQYYEHNPDAPYCVLVIAPKLEKIQKRFAALLK